jgi:hypothetical protein
MRAKLPQIRSGLILPLLLVGTLRGQVATPSADLTYQG